MYYFYNVKPKQKNDMKNCIFILMALFGLFLFQSCDEDLLDVEETFEFESGFVVDTDESSFSGTQLFNLSEDVSLIDSYGDKIKKITIEEVSVWLEYFVGSDEQMLTEGSLSVSDPNGTNWTTVINLNNYLLHELVDEPTELELIQAGINKLGELAAEPPHAFMLAFTADFNTAPLDFFIKFRFKAKMVANPLN